MNSTFPIPSVAELEKQRPIYSAATAIAQTAAEETALAAAAKPDDAKLAKAEADAARELAKCQAEEEKLDRAIQAARRRMGAADRGRIRKERVAAAATALSHARASQVPATKIEQGIALTVEGWVELEAERRAVREASPIELTDYGDLHGFLVRPESLAAAVMLEMRRSGLDFMLRNHPEPIHELPRLTERLARVDAILEGKLEEDAAAGAAPAIEA